MLVPRQVGHEVRRVGVRRAMAYWFILLSVVLWLSILGTIFLII